MGYPWLLIYFNDSVLLKHNLALIGLFKPNKQFWLMQEYFKALLIDASFVDQMNLWIVLILFEMK